MIASILGYSSFAYQGKLFQSFVRAWKPSQLTFRKILVLGAPAAAQAAAEVGAFSLSTIVVTRLGAQATAAHQILLRIASFTFMFPLGVSQATSVLVGHHVGEGDETRARQAGWSGIFLGGGIMTISTLALITMPDLIYGSFTNDHEVLRQGLACLLCVGVFQIFDGIQVSATGALRGAGNTASSMYANVLGYYALGIPLGLWLCFALDMQVLGLWIGLATGLIAISIWLLISWHRRRPVNHPAEHPPGLT
jgi:MATE family multidrug resistance protein